MLGEVLTILKYLCNRRTNRRWIDLQNSTTYQSLNSNAPLIERALSGLLFAVMKRIAWTLVDERFHTHCHKTIAKFYTNRI